MFHTIQNLKTSNLNPSFEFQQLLVSLKRVIDLVMRIRDMGCHSAWLRQSGSTPASGCRRVGPRTPLSPLGIKATSRPKLPPLFAAFPHAEVSHRRSFTAD
jgi:hypothetical protein